MFDDRFIDLLQLSEKHATVSYKNTVYSWNNGDTTDIFPPAVIRAFEIIGNFQTRSHYLRVLIGNNNISKYHTDFALKKEGGKTAFYCLRHDLFIVVLFLEAVEFEVQFVRSRDESHIKRIVNASLGEVADVLIANGRFKLAGSFNI